MCSPYAQALCGAQVVEEVPATAEPPGADAAVWRAGAVLVRLRRLRQGAVVQRAPVGRAAGGRRPARRGAAVRELLRQRPGHVDRAAPLTGGVVHSALRHEPHLRAGVVIELTMPGSAARQASRYGEITPAYASALQHGKELTSATLAEAALDLPVAVHCNDGSARSALQLAEDEDKFIVMEDGKSARRWRLPTFNRRGKVNTDAHRASPRAGTHALCCRAVRCLSTTCVQAWTQVPQHQWYRMFWSRLISTLPISPDVVYGGAY